jgi:hypothetical protein
MNTSYKIAGRHYDAIEYPLIEANTEYEAFKKCPNAIICARCSDGYRGFDSVVDYKTWLNGRAH